MTNEDSSEARNEDRGSDLLGAAGAAHRGADDVRLLVALLVEQALDHRGGHDARVDGVDAHPLLGVLDRRRLGEQAHRALGGLVGRGRTAADEPQHRTSTSTTFQRERGDLEEGDRGRFEQARVELSSLRNQVSLIAPGPVQMRAQYLQDTVEAVMSATLEEWDRVIAHEFLDRAELFRDQLMEVMRVDLGEESENVPG